MTDADHDHSRSLISCDVEKDDYCCTYDPCFDNWACRPDENGVFTLTKDRSAFTTIGLVQLSGRLFNTYSDSHVLAQRSTGFTMTSQDPASTVQTTITRSPNSPFNQQFTVGASNDAAGISSPDNRSSIKALKIGMGVGIPAALILAGVGVVAVYRKKNHNRKIEFNRDREPRSPEGSGLPYNQMGWPPSELGTSGRLPPFCELGLETSREAEPDLVGEGSMARES